MKFVIHAGFHKTGTTTVQRTLQANRNVLRSCAEIFLPSDLEGAARAARRFSITQSDKSLQIFRSELKRILVEPHLDAKKTFLLSCESICGSIPGRKNVWSYHCAGRLLHEACESISEAFGQGHDITVILTTREPDAWMQSVYWQNLRSNRITEDFSDYSRQLKAGADLSALTNAIRSMLNGKASVVEVNLSQVPKGEHMTNVILASAGVPSDNVTPIEGQNSRPTNGIQDLLALNRSNLSEVELGIEKRRYIRRMRRAKRQPQRS